MRVAPIFWIPFVLCIALLFIADIFQIRYYTLQLSTPMFNKISSHDKLFTIHTAGCQIPYMDPFDPRIQKYLETPEMPTCNEGRPPLFTSNLTHIYLVKSSLSSYRLNNITKWDCCYTPFWRREPREGESDNNYQLSSKCYLFNESAFIKEEFIELKCLYGNTTVYTAAFAFVPLKTNITAKVDRNKPLNVLVVGLDAVSRLNLHRQMPKTVHYLKQQDAVELLGYNKVGDNTFPNLIPVTTGFTEAEIRQSCWRNTTDYFDNCSYIWNLYKNEGYVTAFGEDASWMGLFNYQRKGFKKQTTDYAYNYFDLYNDDLTGHSRSMNVYDCSSSGLVFKNLLEYVKKFVTTMDKNGLPYFGFFWSVALSHDYLNKPKLGDEYYYSLFKTLIEDNDFENTALIFMSDHGIRWGGIRQTFQGKMEERLPFVHVLLPKTFQEKYPTAYANLKLNAERLTTPFDLHETLLDLLNPSNFLVEDNLLNLHQSKRGISFFKQINEDRTCEDAGIESHWCTCQHSVVIDTNSIIIEQATQFTIQHLNNLLLDYVECATLTLDKILDARMMTYDSQVNPSSTNTDYMLMFRTLPSEAVFEVSVRHDDELDKFKVMGTISRLNIYGIQSSCITDFHLKLYCYCKSLLS